jgi:hypothetical protein
MKDSFNNKSKQVKELSEQIIFLIKMVYSSLRKLGPLMLHITGFLALRKRGPKMMQITVYCVIGFPCREKHSFIQRENISLKNNKIMKETE